MRLALLVGATPILVAVRLLLWPASLWTRVRAQRRLRSRADRLLFLERVA